MKVWESVRWAISTLLLELDLLNNWFCLFVVIKLTKPNETLDRVGIIKWACPKTYMLDYYYDSIYNSSFKYKYLIILYL